MLKIQIDRALCIGAANCVGVTPEVFQIDGENKSVVINPQGADEETIQAAAEACPTQAILLFDQAGNQIYP